MGQENDAFSHPNLDKLHVIVSIVDMCFLHSYSYDVTLEGPEEQVSEFKRAAENHLENGIHSLKCVNQQLKERREKGNGEKK